MPERERGRGSRWQNTKGKGSKEKEGVKIALVDFDDRHNGCPFEKEREERRGIKPGLSRR